MGYDFPIGPPPRPPRSWADVEALVEQQIVTPNEARRILTREEAKARFTTKAVIAPDLREKTFFERVWERLFG